MSIKTECQLRPANCRCDKTGEVLARYNITLAVSGLTLAQASALLPEINTELERSVVPLRSIDESDTPAPAAGH